MNALYTVPGVPPAPKGRKYRNPLPPPGEKETLRARMHEFWKGPTCAA